MKELPMHLPIEFSYKRNKFEEKLIEFSNKAFTNMPSGIMFAILNNAMFLYFCYYKRPFFYMFIFSYLLIFVFHIIIIQLVGNR